MCCTNIMQSSSKTRRGGLCVYVDDACCSNVVSSAFLLLSAERLVHNENSRDHKSLSLHGFTQRRCAYMSNIINRPVCILLLLQKLMDCWRMPNPLGLQSALPTINPGLYLTLRLSSRKVRKQNMQRELRGRGKR